MTQGWLIAAAGGRGGFPSVGQSGGEGGFKASPSLWKSSLKWGGCQVQGIVCLAWLVVKQLQKQKKTKKRKENTLG